MPKIIWIFFIILILNFLILDAVSTKFLNISPGFAAKQKVVDKDIVFVLDCSGSMAGEKMEQARKALNFCVANLNSGDRFNIIRT